MSMADFVCAHCGKPSKKYVGHLNRSAKIGAPVYCTKACSAEARKTTAEQKKAVKAAYDKQNIQRPEIRAKRKAYNETPTGRAAQKRRRQTRMPKHVEYCRQPEYRAKKKVYDHKYSYEKQYGEFAEAAKILAQLEHEIDKYQAKLENDTLNKSKKRKRLWTKIKQQPLN